MPERRASRSEIRLPATRLPRELFFLYLVAPIVTAPIVSKGFFDLPLSVMPLSIAGNFVPFLTISPVIHLLYYFVMPSLINRIHSLQARLFVHAGVSALAAAGVAMLIRPIMLLFSKGKFSILSFGATCVIMTWAFVLPALVVQEMRDRAEDAQQKLHEERQAALRAQLEAIQSRTNPHFLFNAMNTVASLIHEDAELAERTLLRLADFLRYALQRSRLDEAALTLEIEMLEDYLEIQRARFGDRLRYAIEIEPDLLAIKLPPFLLQPLVENAVLHGIAERPSGGSLRVTARRRAGQVVLRVDDDGPGPGASTHRGTGTSLADLERRLALLYGDACSLTTRANEQGGFTVELTVPELRGKI